MRKGCALIRSNLGLDPTGMGYEEWADAYTEAIWLEGWRNRNTARTLTALFGQALEAGTR